MRIEPAFLFDLDGTLVDSVYQRASQKWWVLVRVF
jgi:beta-phosphoglucomutase-like phosphatase (HAD superfamily)